MLVERLELIERHLRIMLSNFREMRRQLLLVVRFDVAQLTILGSKGLRNIWLHGLSWQLVNSEHRINIPLALISHQISMRLLIVCGDTVFGNRIGIEIVLLLTFSFWSTQSANRSLGESSWASWVALVSQLALWLCRSEDKLLVLVSVVVLQAILQDTSTPLASMDVDISFSAVFEDGQDSIFAFPPDLYDLVANDGYFVIWGLMK